MNEIPSIEMLLEMNKKGLRRLRAAGTNKRMFLLDSEEKEIPATPLSYPEPLSVANTTDPFNLSLGERCYSFSPAYLSWHGFLTSPEMRLVLGKDYSGNHDTSDIHAMLEVGGNGPARANAYVLGNKVSGIHQYHQFVVVAVQYYRIDPQRHRELGISSRRNNETWKGNLAFRIADIERERKESSSLLVQPR
ncbi:hypothetical protein HY501_02515 [Candidatus Woesearchaeota archaeon]|nr:hypothetical protein [Candidatus Woesearchaeota archaeon]